jgi:microcompartment protein CcmL/EutN
MAEPMSPALGLLEVDSIAVGIAAGDAMAKRAPIDVVYAGTVHPGRYLVLVAGAVADVEEAMDAGGDEAGRCVLDAVLLPHIHPDVVAGIRGARREGAGEALGVVETPTVASIIDAADAGVKEAAVRLLELRLADGLGGKGYLLFGGSVSDVEAAVDAAVARAHGARVTHRVIAQLHGEMRQNLAAAGRFRDRVASVAADAAGDRPAGPDGSAA